MFFRPRSAPDPAIARLDSLRRSLNEPVVSISELPVGPASAVIALHRFAPEGSERLPSEGFVGSTVAVRCRRTAEVVFFASDDDESGGRTGAIRAHACGPGADIDPDAVWGALPAEAALSFAESMGFLFDDALFASDDARGDSLAERIWAEFAGLPAAAHEARVEGSRRAVPACASPQELLTKQGLLTKFRRAQWLLAAGATDRNV